LLPAPEIIGSKSSFVAILLGDTSGLGVVEAPSGSIGSISAQELERVLPSEVDGQIGPNGTLLCMTWQRSLLSVAEADRDGRGRGLEEGGLGGVVGWKASDSVSVWASQGVSSDWKRPERTGDCSLVELSPSEAFGTVVGIGRRNLENSGSLRPIHRRVRKIAPFEIRTTALLYEQGGL